MNNREEWARRGEAVTAEMVAKARDKDLARMEKQASMRGPVIAEMKAAVLSMRSPQNTSEMFKQPSFRHLSVEPDVAESIATAQSGFRRQPPSRGSLSRPRPNHAMSIGTAEREAMKNFRKLKPTGSGHLPRRVMAQNPAGLRPGPAITPTKESTSQMNMKKPQRRGSMTQECDG